MNQKTKVALIGLGRWGQVLLKELVQQTEVKYECNSQSDQGAVFSDSEIQAVFIATPTETHFEIARKAMEAGKHVFLEKPATTKRGDLEVLVNLAQEKGLRFAVGYEFIHDPAMKKMKELLGNRKIKRLIFKWYKWGTFKNDAVAHLLSHEISVAEYLGIELTPLSCRKTRVISGSDIVKTEFDVASSLINRVSFFKEKTVKVITEEAGYLWKNGRLFEIDTSGNLAKEIEVQGPSSVKAEISDFLSAIQENREPQSSGKFALRVYKVIERV